MERKTEIPREPKSLAPADPIVTAAELAAAVIAGKKSISEARYILQSIKHPGERLKMQYEFRQLLWAKLGLHHGIDKWGDYVASLKKLQSQFIPE